MCLGCIIHLVGCLCPHGKFPPDKEGLSLQHGLHYGTCLVLHGFAEAMLDGNDCVACLQYVDGIL